MVTVMSSFVVVVTTSFVLAVTRCAKHLVLRMSYKFRYTDVNNESLSIILATRTHLSV